MSYLSLLASALWVRTWLRPSFFFFFKVPDIFSPIIPISAKTHCITCHINQRSDLLLQAAIFSPEQQIFCAGSIRLTLFLMMTSHNFFKVLQHLKVQPLKTNTWQLFQISLFTLTEHMAGGQGGCDGPPNGANHSSDIHSGAMWYLWVAVYYRQTPSFVTLLSLTLSLSLSSISIFFSSPTIPIWFDHSLELGERNKGREGRGRRGSAHEFVLWDRAEAGTRAASGDWNSGKVKPTVGAVQEELPRESASRRWQRGDHTNMAAESLPCLCLLYIFSGIFCPAFAARLGEQQQSVINVRYFKQSFLADCNSMAVFIWWISDNC